MEVTQDKRTAIAKVVSDLLCWAEHPDPEALTDSWLNAYKNEISRVTNLLPSEPLAQEAKRLSYKFATLLCDNPTLSTVRVQDWPIKRFRDLFDDLSEVERQLSGNVRKDDDIWTEWSKPAGWRKAWGDKHHQLTDSGFRKRRDKLIESGNCQAGEGKKPLYRFKVQALEELGWAIQPV